VFTACYDSLLHDMNGVAQAEVEADRELAGGAE
jgi:hypothetical protein